jgi:hypothetical protein
VGRINHRTNLITLPFSSDLMVIQNRSENTFFCKCAINHTADDFSEVVAENPRGGKNVVILQISEEEIVHCDMSNIFL